LRLELSLNQQVALTEHLRDLVSGVRTILSLEGGESPAADRSAYLSAAGLSPPSRLRIVLTPPVDIQAELTLHSKLNMGFSPHPNHFSSDTFSNLLAFTGDA